jgi:intracellular septation protein
MNQNDPKAPPVSGTKLLIDLGPLVVFILAYVLTKNPFKATAAFIVAMSVALVFARIKLGKIPLLLIFSFIMVVLFGGLTIVLHDERFIQMKPSLYYAVVAAMLFYGTATKKALLKNVFEDVYPDMSAHGWHILGRNFAWLFFTMLMLNEGIRHFASFEQWAWAKLWLFTPLTFLFGAIHVPFIMRESQSDPI